MAIFLDNAEPTNYKVGASQVSKVFLGDQQVWPAALITTQPKNNFSATYSALAPFRVNSANLIINGDFENGTSGWIASNVDVTTWPGSGGLWLDLMSCTPGYVEQTVKTVPGVTYTLTFFLAGNCGCRPDWPCANNGQTNTENSKSCRVSAGSATQDFSVSCSGVFPTSNSSMNWLSRSMTFTATAAQTLIRFESLTPTTGCFGAAISFVQLFAAATSSLSYQWQGYYYDYNTGNFGWNDISGATAATLNLSGNAASNYGIDQYSTGGMMQLRVVVTNSATEESATSQVVRWLDYSALGPYANFYGDLGAESSGSTNLYGTTYSNVALQEDETVSVSVYDMGFTAYDLSWYTSNAFTIKLQRSTDAKTWVDISVSHYRSAGFWFNTSIEAQSGVVYYRVLIVANWPLTVNNGTQSTKRWPAEFIAGAYKLTWPLRVTALRATYIASDVMTHERATSLLLTSEFADVMAHERATSLLLTSEFADVMAHERATSLLLTSEFADVMAHERATSLLLTSEFVDVLATPTPAVPTPPTEPLNLVGTFGDTEVSLAWSAPELNGGRPITDYVVEYRPVGDAGWQTFSDGTGTSTSAVVTGLTNNVEYMFRVAAINSIGTGAPASVGPIRPRTVLTITITEQPKNDYSTGYATAPNIGLTATITGVDTTITYQWEAYYYDYNTGTYGWNALSGQTTNTFTLAPNSYFDLTGDWDMQYGGTVQLRCRLTNEDAQPKTTQVVRWFNAANVMYPYVNWYTTNGNYPNGGSPQTITPSEGEGVLVNVNGYGYYMDTSWYTGNDAKVRIQISTDNATWTDLYTADFRGGVYVDWQLPASTGIKFYRAVVEMIWPRTATNGTGFATRTTPFVFCCTTDGYSILRVTWPSGVPDAPTNVVADLYGEGVRLSWTDPASDGGSAITGYVVQYSTNNGGSWTTTTLEPFEGYRGYFPFVGPPVDHVFRVAATNSVGTGNYSAPSNSVGGA